ncbi:MAG: carbamoyltransferase HypF [Rhodospirillales bacterium]|nr:MAG: carbamoyltransferase HypF [Rhodospirillales bacterium]
MADGVPTRVGLACAVPPVLAVGAFLKNTVTAAVGREAAVSPTVGNLDTADAVLAFEAWATALLDQLGGAPVVIAHDLHPDFHSTRFAWALAQATGARASPVQHHHAHVAAVMAEHGRTGPTLGLALDGFGLGSDGGSWGGELLRVDRTGFVRLGQLSPLAQPGGDKAAREPWRMAAAALHALGRGDEIAGRFAAFPGAPLLAAMLRRGINSPPTSSCGRLFDAACGLLGVCPVAAFEGEAPMALEKLVQDPRADPAGWRLGDDGVLDLTPLLARLDGLQPADGADLFHGTLAAALSAWVARAAEATGITAVALSGGCFFNAVLRRLLTEQLERSGLQPLMPVQLGPGDPAVSLGQAWAAALSARDEE